MKLVLALAVLVGIVSTVSPAEARHRRMAPISYAADDFCNGSWPNAPRCEGVALSARGLKIARSGFGTARQRYTPVRKAKRRAISARPQALAARPLPEPVRSPARAVGAPGPHLEFLADVPPRGMTSKALRASLNLDFPKILENGRAVIRATTGAVAYVAAHAAGAFQCVVNALEATGYRITEMGGFADHGHISHSLHYSGRAIDINQVERNVTVPPMPRNEIAIANGCGLTSGAVWRNADSGHFELHDGKTRYASARRHHRHVRYARHHHRGKVRLATR